MSPARVLLDARKARDWGIGTYVRALVRGLAEREEWTLSVVALPGDEGLFPAGVAVLPCAAPHYSVRELLAVRAVIARERPELFHAPHYVVPLFPPRATVVTVHDLMHLTRREHASAARRAYAQVMLRRAVRSAARVLVDSEATKRELLAFRPAAAAKVRVARPALEPRFLELVDAGERARVRQEHGLDGRYVLFLGNDKPHKNLDGLLEAFAAARLPARLVLAGGPRAARPDRAEKIAAHGLSGRVSDLAYVPERDVAPLLAEALLLALPSFAEGFGLPALEAQAVGTPVVCSDIPALREATGGAALFAQPEKPSTFASAMNELQADAALRADLVARGRAHAAGCTRARLAETVSDVYREVLGP